jgi:pimeloyl-ACP methyl ester carboxylesterase
MTAAATPSKPDTVVLVHGLWMTPLCWENWITRYEARGYRVFAPAWPGMEGDIDELRRNPSGIARLTVTEILDSYEKVIRALVSPPIIMGHSFGGGFTQVLLDRGLGAAGVAIDSATVKGVFKLPLSNAPVRLADPQEPREPPQGSPPDRQTVPLRLREHAERGESAKVYEWYAIPGPGGILFEGSMVNLPGSALRVDYNKPDRAPLLFIAGGADHIVPAAVNKSNVKLYRKSKSEAIVDYKEFPGRRTTRWARTAGRKSPTMPSSGPEKNAGLGAKPVQARRSEERQAESVGPRRV